MKTFKGTASFDFKAVVPQQFLDTLREQAVDPEQTTPFLAEMNARHPKDDDAFLEAILKNGVRRNISDYIKGNFIAAGLGGSVSPARIEVTGMPPGFEDTKVVPQVVLRERTLSAVEVADNTPAPASEELNAAHDEQEQA